VLNITLEVFWTEVLPGGKDEPGDGLAVDPDGEYRFLLIEVSVYVVVTRALD
jgi:hypothetical protein